MQRASIELIKDVEGGSKLSTGDHLCAVKEERNDNRKTWYDVNEAKLEGIFDTPNVFKRRIFLLDRQTGSCLTI